MKGRRQRKQNPPQHRLWLLSADLTEVRMDEVVNQCVQAELNAVLSFLLPCCALKPVIMAGKELRAVFSSLCLWAFVCANTWVRTHICA